MTEARQSRSSRLEGARVGRGVSSVETADNVCMTIRPDLSLA